MARERVDYCVAEGLMLRAGLAFHSGDLDSAVELLEEAESLGDDADLILSRTSMMRARGVLLGGDEGEALVAKADTLMREQGVHKPARVAEIFASGFVARKGGA